jgi:pSer/pThr/pTyr-binding forkhead associated (FHA) protein
MPFVLRVIAGQSVGARLLFPPGEYVFGRAEGCHVRFALTRPVSRRHCLLCVTEQGASIRDLNSRNRTMVNREIVRSNDPPRVLHDGDQLWLPGTTFLVEMGLADDPSLAVPVSVLGPATDQTFYFSEGQTQVEIAIPGLDQDRRGH